MEEAIKKAEHIGAFSTREEKEAIWNLAQQYITEGGLAIEVGTWTGGSAVIIGEVCRQKHARLICIDAFSRDIHGIGRGVHTETFRVALVNCQDLPIDYMAGDSRNFVNYLKPGIADFIFIDGDHRLPTVRADIEGYWEALRPGGCYLMHDYGTPCDVKEVVDRFFALEQMHQVSDSVYVIKRDKE